LNGGKHGRKAATTAARQFRHDRSPRLHGKTRLSENRHHDNNKFLRVDWSSLNRDTVATTTFFEIPNKLEIWSGTIRSTTRQYWYDSSSIRVHPSATNSASSSTCSRS
jgi:hypothetical protein